MPSKTHIPKAVRRAVWLQYIGPKFKSKCYVKWCPNYIDALGSWHVGHNIPESQGGTLSIDNLRPICADCNLGMGDRYTIEEWSDTFSGKNKGLCNAVRGLLKLSCWKPTIEAKPSSEQP